MATLSKHHIVNAGIGDTWATWDDFPNIADFHPDVTNSFTINATAATGMGAERKCEFGPKDYALEKIVGYTPQKQIVIDLYEVSFPIRDAVATFDFEEVDTNRTRVTMTMRFTPKMGLLGKMMLPLMKRQFGAALEKLLANNARHVENRPRLAA